MAIGRSNPLRQRLIAAGAQPERAQQFVEQNIFNKGPQLTTFGGSNPKVLGDPYDDKTQQALKDYFPNLYRPPTSDSPDFKPYFDVVLGKGAYDNFYNKSFATKAPTYTIALNKAPKGSFEFVVANLTQQNFTPESIVTKLLAEGNTADKTDEAVTAYVYKIFNEYNDAQAKVNEDLVKRLEQDKAYKFGLPDIKLRYGLTTDLNKGTISIALQPAVANALSKYKQDPAFASKQQAFLTKALAEVTKAKLTPYIDAKKLGEKFRNKRP